MRPFSIDVPQSDVLDLRARLRSTRWPEPASVDDWAQGVPLDYVRDLCGYWADGYQWYDRQARFNDFDQFVTDIDGLRVHFLHVRSVRPRALPLVLTHGWPGSFVEFIDVIEALTETFHVVVPSLPGFGWSGKPANRGWGVQRIADAWSTLMGSLGYDRFGAQGGDWGSLVATQLAVRHPDRVVGIHLNMVYADPPHQQTQFTTREREALLKIEHYRRADSGYARIQGTRPQTLGYGLMDSPAGLCAWILDKFWAWTDCEGDPVGVLGPDRLLDNIATYWFSGTAASAARLYWESIEMPYAGADAVSVPTGVSLFPKDIYLPPQEWVASRYRDVRMWHELDSGGHFAAMERPMTFVDEVRAFFEGAL